MTTLAFGARFTAAERERVLRIGARLGCDPSHLMACMYFESKLDPAAVNASSGATGLIQFMPGSGRSADALGTTTAALATMTRLEQLEFVDRYFDLPWVHGAGRIPTLADVYLAIFAPAHIGKPDDFVLYQAPSDAYRLNRALDVNNDGKITKAEAASFVARALELGLQPGNAWGMTDGTRAPRTDAAPPPVEGHKMGAIAGPLLASLIPQVLGLFTARAQATIAKATGADPTVAGQFMQNLIAKVGEVTGIPVTDDTTAVQAVGKLTAAPAPEKVEQLEEHALDYLDKIAPMLDKLAAHEIAVRKAADDSADRAAARGQKDPRDIAILLTRAGIGLFALAMVLVGGALVVQLVKDSDHQVDPLLASLLTILIYAAARMAESPYRYRFGGTAESSVVESGNVAIRAAIPTGGKQ